MPISLPPRRDSRRLSMHPLERRALLAAGAVDTSFGTGGLVSVPAVEGSARVTDMEVMTGTSAGDGRIVVTATSPGDGRLTVLRLRPDGGFDPTFGDGGRAASDLGRDAQALGVAIQPDNRIVVVGSRGREYFVLRYNTNGKHDRTFGDGGLLSRTFGDNVSVARDVVVAGGDVFVVGEARLADGTTAAAMSKLDSRGRPATEFGDDGTLVTKFASPLSGPHTFSVTRVVSENSTRGNFLIAGGFSNGLLANETDDDALAVMRVQFDGVPDATFGNGGLALADLAARGETATGIASDLEQRPVVSVGGAGVLGAMRFRENGRRDNTFGRNGLARIAGLEGEARDVTLDQRTNQIVVAGQLSGQPRVARFGPSGAPDDAFGAGGVTGPEPLGINDRPDRIIEAFDGTYLVGALGDVDGPDQSLALAKYFDRAGPFARVHARDLTVPRAESLVFVVQWRDSDGIDVATIGDGDLRVDNMNGFARNARFFSIDRTVGPGNVFVKYAIAPPGGAWDAADNGFYAISVRPNQVQSTEGVFAEPGFLQSLRVNIA